MAAPPAQGQLAVELRGSLNNAIGDFGVVGDDFITAETPVEYLALDLALHIHLSGLGSR